MRCWLTIAFLGTVVFSNPASASKWTSADLAAMPAYCAGRYARVTNQAEYKRWEAQYGADFLHTHHLCDAIGLLNKYPGVTSPIGKREMMKSIMGNLDYMIQNAKSDFKLMSDVYYYRSQAHSLSGRRAEAIRDLRKAIELAPAFVPAYTLLADYLQRAGQHKEALQVVADGLAQKPDSLSLQRLYSKLGGDPQAIPRSPASTSPANDATHPHTPAAGDMAPLKRAVFDVGKVMYAGVNVLAEAGSYVFIEFREASPGDRSRVLMTVSSRIPQPASRVVRIGIDMGGYRNMLSSIKVADPVQASHYLVTQGAASEPHAFWPKFTPHYSIKFTRARNEKKYDLYDPRALPPGKSLPVELHLSTGYAIDDLVEAVKKGIRDSSGIRLAVILNHTKGYRPDPKSTIMDDGGFVTGSLRLVEGFDQPGNPRADVQAAASEKSVAPPSSDPAKSEQAPLQSHAVDATNINTRESAPAVTAAPSGSKNTPWCRFCPMQ